MTSVILFCSICNAKAVFVALLKHKGLVKCYIKLLNCIYFINLKRFLLILYTIQQTYINETKKKETFIKKITHTAF